MRKQLISFAQVRKFCKISSSRGGFNPKSHPLRTPLLIVGVFRGCGGLRTGRRCCSTNQEVCCHVFLKFSRKRCERADHTVNIELSFSSLSLFGYNNGNIGLGLESYQPVACPLTSIGYSKRVHYRFKLKDIIIGRHTSTTVWEPLLTGTAFNYCCFFGFIT